TSIIPLNFLLLNIIGINNIQFLLGLVFASFLFVYAIIYLVNILKPIFLYPNFMTRLLSSHSFDFDFSPLNDFYKVIQWFSAYFLLSLVIDSIQQFFGIQIGNPLTNNPLLSLFYLSAAPLNEEILFRVIFLGVPLSLILFRYKNSFVSALLYPGDNLQIKSKSQKKILIIVILLNSVFFGFAHVMFGGHYEIGKVTQATLGGIFLCCVYFRYGLGSSIMFHWISNYVIFSYELFGSIVFRIPWNDETNNYFLIILYFIFIIGGMLFLIDASKRLIKDIQKNKKLTGL
ncbi:MAG TPA: CPBP family glutamic-type intramembrane protease, partial [Candidatus Nitrosocosmicus sp.]|nr:CPBP family glutamic-type intramembrane protease [Candidatus Nitrosocosmicus sp.]